MRFTRHDESIQASPSLNRRAYEAPLWSPWFSWGIPFTTPRQGMGSQAGAGLIYETNVLCICSRLGSISLDGCIGLHQPGGVCTSAANYGLKKTTMSKLSVTRQMRTCTHTGTSMFRTIENRRDKMKSSAVHRKVKPSSVWRVDDAEFVNTPQIRKPPCCTPIISSQSGGPGA
jgi:hypothetical protein